MENDLTELRQKLLAEKNLLEQELGQMGRKNKSVPGDWEAVPPIVESEAEADKNDAADLVEGFEEAVATEGELEQRLSQIDRALKSMENGSYGICRVCKNPIEPKRLSANPAASTCIAHKDS